VLARLDEIDGVAESRVDWTGTRFLLALESDVPARRVERAASATLGEETRVLGEDERSDVLASYREGEVWMRAGETLRLSRFEAGVLAERYGGEAARQLGLGAEETRRLTALFEAELIRAFDRTHAGQGIEDLPTELDAAAGRVLDASAAFLTGEQRAALAEYLACFRAANAR